MVELLAPAGSPEQFLAAVAAGADAVYLGGKHFSARRFAANFSDREMESAVHLAHVKGVSVYVTLNTLMNDKEMEQLPDYLHFLESIHIDGLLVQDWGVISTVKKLAPDLPLHASTQMTVSNLDSVLYLEKMGFTRVVLSRELSLEEIKEITSRCHCEIEVFIHGALCVSYSGQCLMSSFLGGRSGNRGACAQPCRMPYELTDSFGKPVRNHTGHYLLSLKDLMGLRDIPDLIGAGVSSLKIEGRMKSPEYGYHVVSVYRKAIDAALQHKKIPVKEFGEEIQKEFNRGYSDSYFTHREGPDMITRYSANNLGIFAGTAMSADKGRFNFKAGRNNLYGQKEINGITFLSSAREMKFVPISKVKQIEGNLYAVTVSDKPDPEAPVYWTTEKHKSGFALKDMKNKIPLSFFLKAEEGEPLLLEARDDRGHHVSVHSSYIAEKAKKKAVSKEEAVRQLSRLGNTLFYFSDLTFINADCMIPKSILNHLRNEAVSRIETERCNEFLSRRHQILSENTLFLPDRAVFKKEPHLWVRTDSSDHIKAAFQHGIRYIIFGGESLHHVPLSLKQYEEAARFAKENKIFIAFAAPRVVREENESRVRLQLETLEKLHPDAFYIEYPGALYALGRRKSPIPVLLGSSFNLFNSKSLKWAVRAGASGAFLSQELTLSQMKALSGLMPCGAYIFGRQELMISEYCAVNAVMSDRDKKHCPAPCRQHHYFLKDQNRRLFPLKTDEWCHMHVMNSKVLNMLPFMDKLEKSGLDFLVLDTRDMDEAGKVIESFATKFAVPGQKEDPLHFRNTTQGHFFKGVL